MSLRLELHAIVQQLLARDEPRISLDALGDAIGTTLVSTEDIENILCALEAEGRTVDELEVRSASAELLATLTAARTLRTQLGRAPRVDEIAEHANLSAAVVRGALLFARTLQR